MNAMEITDDAFDQMAFLEPRLQPLVSQFYPGMQDEFYQGLLSLESGQRHNLVQSLFYLEQLGDVELFHMRMRLDNLLINANMHAGIADTLDATFRGLEARQQLSEMDHLPEEYLALQGFLLFLEAFSHGNNDDWYADEDGLSCLAGAELWCYRNRIGDFSYSLPEQAVDGENESLALRVKQGYVIFRKRFESSCPESQCLGVYVDQLSDRAMTSLSLENPTSNNIKRILLHYLMNQH